MAAWMFNRESPYNSVRSRLRFVRSEIMFNQHVPKPVTQTVSDCAAVLDKLHNDLMALLSDDLYR